MAPETNPGKTLKIGKDSRFLALCAMRSEAETLATATS